MDFTSMFDKSLFNENSFNAAGGSTDENGYAVIKITPAFPRIGAKNIDTAIKGIVKEGLNFAIQANWDENAMAGLVPSGDLIDTLKDGINIVKNIGGAVGVAELGAVISSRKVYRKSGYLSITPEFRIVDWNANGNPLISALVLAVYCIPDKSYGESQKGKVEDKIKMISDAATAIAAQTAYTASLAASTALGSPNYAEAQKASDAVANGIKKTGQFVEGAAKKIEQGVYDLSDKFLGQGSGKALKDLKDLTLEDMTTLRASPTPVRVEIGQYFDHPDMVIENIDFSFSKEMTRMGPLYVDFKLSLSSRHIMGDINDVGLYLPTPSRVQFTDQPFIKFSGLGR